MTRARGVAVIVGIMATLATLFVVRAWRAPLPSSESSGAGEDRRAAVSTANSDEAQGAPAPAAEGRGSRTPPDASTALGARDPADAWRGQVARALDRIARERLGHGLAPADQTRLVDALATVGPAARTLDRESLDPDDPASIARVREQTAALVSADRICRDVLGIGVAELLRMLDPGGVEDRGRSTD